MQHDEWQTLTVTEVGQTPKGRPTIKAGGNSFLVGNDCPTPKAGQTIEARTSVSHKDGKAYNWLNEWKASTTQPTATNGNGHAPTPDAEMRFISNVVGQAIQAGTIKDPGQITAWALAAKQTLVDLGEP